MENFKIATPEIESLLNFGLKTYDLDFFGICTYQKNSLEKNFNTPFFGYFWKFRTSIWAPYNQNFSNLKKVLNQLWKSLPSVKISKISLKNCGFGGPIATCMFQELRKDIGLVAYPIFMNFWMTNPNFHHRRVVLEYRLLMVLCGKLPKRCFQSMKKGI